MSLPELKIEDFPLRGVSLIEASAGTGKTWTITRLYARALLEQRLSVQQILVVTFTDAATQELKGRIREFISGLLDAIESGKQPAGDYEPLFSLWRGKPEAVEILRNALIDMDEASIHTIHGFCQRALAAYPLDTGSLLQQELLEDEAELKLAAMRDYWRRQVVGLPDFEMRCLLDVCASPEAMLRIVDPILKNPEAVEGQAGDAAATAWQALADAAQQFTRLWNEEEYRARLIGDDRIFKDIRRNWIVKPCALANEFAARPDIRLLRDKAWKWLSWSQLESRLLDADTPEAELALFHLAGRLPRLYENWKREWLVAAARELLADIETRKQRQMLVSFDDLIGRLQQALSDNDRLARRLREDYPLALVDEFQDTDQRQFEIFHRIQAADEACGLVMIGDPKQSIYGFRGGDVFTYHKARRSAARQFTLARNYRSRPAMVQAVNRIFGAAENPFVFEQLMAFQPVRAARDGLCLEDPQGDEALVVWREPCAEKAAGAGSLDQPFADYCAREIQRLLSEGRLRLNSSRDAQMRPVKAGDIAVLVDTHAQARQVQQALSRRGISSALRSQESVFQSEQAREMLRLLDAVIEADASRLAALLAGELFGWNAARIQALQADGAETIRQLEALRDYHELWRKQGIMVMMTRLLAGHGSLPRLLALPDGERRVSNWLQLIELLQQQGSRHANPAQSLRWLQQQVHGHSELQADSHQLQLESDRELVAILTIHKSKGLEFPLVFIPYAWRITQNKLKPADCFVTHDAEGDKRIHLFDDAFVADWRREQLAEQLRLLYVATTRAVHRCYLGWCRARGTENTALAHLLYRTDSGGVELPCGESGDFDAPWQRLIQQGASIRLQEPPTEPDHDKDYREEKEQAPPARQLHRPLQREWRMSSYSRMVSGHFDADVEQAEHADPAPAEIEQPEATPAKLTRFSFHKGAKAGNFLHEWLEQQPLDQPANEALIREKLEAYGYDEEWLPVLRDWCEDIRGCDLGGHRLADLAPEQCAREMEFLMSCQGLDVEALNDFLHRHDYLRPERRLAFDTLHGFLQGFIDLVYEIDGRFYVLDYKSNYLGPRQQDYDPDSCREAMFEHDYHLQYLIYTLALHRHLGKLLPDYDYERHCGGVRYLFLRGLSASSGMDYGVFSHRPPRAVIEELDGLLEGRAP